PGSGPAPHRLQAAAQLAASLGLGLELLLAAGLLRLSAIDDFGALAAVGAIVLLRTLVTIGSGSGSSRPMSSTTRARRAARSASTGLSPDVHVVAEAQRRL